MSRRDDISFQSGRSGASRSAYSSSLSSGYDSSGYSGSSSRRGAVERHADRHDNFALRLAQHYLEGPFSGRRNASQSHHHHHHHKDQGSSYNSSSSSYKSSKKHQSPSRSGGGFYTEPQVIREQVRTARGPPPPPPAASGWYAAGVGSKSGMHATRQGFGPSSAPRQTAHVDPIWAAPNLHGMRRGQTTRGAVLVDE